MRKKFSLWIVLSLTMLSSCSQKLPSASSSSLPSETKPSSTPSTSHESQTSTKGIYTKLKEGLQDLSESFTLKGTLIYTYESASSSSSDSSQTTQNCLVEVNRDSYYYEESDQGSDDIVAYDSFYKGEDGKLHSREINLMNNTVLDTYSDALYDDVMRNPFSSLEVKNIKAIRKMPDWYEFSNNQDKKDVAYFLTGYDVNSTSQTPLYVTQLAFHYDGDQIDRFRIQLDASSSDDDYSTAYQFLFELDVFDIKNTTPRSIQPFEHTANHNHLKNAMDKLKLSENYTIEIQDDYVSSPQENETYEYRIDSENLFSDIKHSREFTFKDEKGETFTEEMDYYLCYKNLETADGKKPYVLSFKADDSHELLQARELNEYLGAESGQYHFSDLLPYFSTIASECFKDEGTYFTAYVSTEDYCLGAFLPIFEQSSGYEMKVYVNNSNDTIERITLDGEVSLADSSTTKLTRTITYKNISSTTIPDYLKNYSIGESK